jgi:hypothetical protein
MHNFSIIINLKNIYMIKKITLLVAVVALSTAVFGQTTFGIKAGTNLAKMKFSGGGITIDAKMKAGLLVGAFVNFPVNDNVSFQPEFLFSQGGGKIDIMGTTGKEENNYIAVPVMLKYSLGEIKLLAGPQFGYLLSAKEDGTDIKDAYKSLDYGISLGAGYETEGGFGLDARYYFGLANVNNDPTATDMTVKNSGIQVVLYFRFK